MLDASQNNSEKKAQRTPSRGPNPVDVHIGKRLRLRRMMVGLSQEDVANAVGVAFQQIQKYECAVNRISTSRLWALGAALQCPVSFFYEGMDGSVQAGGQGGDTAAQIAEDDVSNRQETLKLVRAYYTIRQPDTRRQILELAVSLGGGRPQQTPQVAAE